MFPARRPNYIVSREQQIEHAADAAPDRVGPNAPGKSGATDDGDVRGKLRAKLPFFRAMLWVLVYSTAGLFLISLILLHGLRPQTKIIGGAMLLALALIAVSYGLQWHG
jgi:hypothetical protein